jgi:hypothetical protein
VNFTGRKPELERGAKQNMRRSLNRRLERLEARFVPVVKPRDFTIHFIAPGGTVVQKLYFRGGREIWDPPRGLDPGPEPLGNDVL